MCQTCRTRFDGGEPEDNCPLCGAPRGKHSYLGWELRAYVHGEAIGTEADVEYRLAKVSADGVQSRTRLLPAAIFQSQGVRWGFYFAWKLLAGEVERVEFADVLGEE